MLKSYLYITPLLLLTGCIALKVKKLDVPSLIQLGEEDSVILDCEYSLGSDEPSGLVVKWFVDKLNPVYQWIAHPSGNAPQDLGLLKGKIDIGYIASSDPLHAHRAIRILNPTVDMSGNYTCVVSTFTAEDSMTKSMLVYSIIGENIRLSYETVGDVLTLLCLVKDVYPKPIITIMANSVPLDVTSNITIAQGLYDVRAAAELSASDVEDGTVLQCRVTLAQNNHTEAISVTYYPGSTASRPLHSLIFTAALAAVSLLVRSSNY